MGSFPQAHWCEGAPADHTSGSPAEIKKIVAQRLNSVMATQIGTLKINFVVTDTLRIQVDKRDSHRYKLKADISGVNFRERLWVVSALS